MGSDSWGRDETVASAGSPGDDLDARRPRPEDRPCPQVEAVAGFDVAGWNLPADDGGGDFFDFQQVPSGCLAVTVADVSGRGDGAVRALVECRELLRAAL